MEYKSIHIFKMPVPKILKNANECDACISSIMLQINISLIDIIKTLVRTSSY